MFRYINMPMAMDIAVFIFNTRPVGITHPPTLLGTKKAKMEPSGRFADFRGLLLFTQMSTDCPRTF